MSDFSNPPKLTKEDLDSIRAKVKAQAIKAMREAQIADRGDYTLVVGKKRKTFTSFEKIEKTMGVRLTDDDRAALNHAQKYGNVLFANVNPYHAEMGMGEPGHVPGILLADTQEALDATFYALREEV